MVVFGGWCTSSNTDDPLAFEATTTTNTAPAAEEASGERPQSFLNDVYLLDIDTFVWRVVNTVGIPPRPRCQAACFVVPSDTAISTVIDSICGNVSNAGIADDTTVTSSTLKNDQSMEDFDIDSTMDSLKRLAGTTAISSSTPTKETGYLVIFGGACHNEEVYLSTYYIAFNFYY